MTGQAQVSLRGSRVQIGGWLKDKWHVDTLLGVGGVGTVYAVTHRNRSRAAIKVLHADLALDADLVARFLREGYAANAVGHPGVVQVLDDDRTDDGLVFLVMELLDGETLDQHARKQGGKLPVAEALAVADGVLAVLEAAHDKGIVHRDLKTENIFLCRDGAVKVLDFGLARMRESSGPPRSGTQVGAMMGTPGFMPPEQIRGLWDRVDARSDLWAVGATLHALLTGRRVHEADGEPLDVFATATQPVPSIAKQLPDAAPAVVTLVDRALALRPDARWPSATAMRVALAEALPGVVRPAHSVTLPGAPARGPASGPISSPVSSHSARAPASGAGAFVSIASGGPQIRVPKEMEPSSTSLPDNVSPVEIAPGTFWVGMRDPKSIFHANPYLRVFKSGALEPYNLLVDPGSSSDFAVVSSKVGSVAGRLGALSGMFINHQDPDVGSSAAQISGRYAPRASIFCSEATWRLIVHFNLPRDRFVDTDAARRGFDVPTGHRLIPVPTPYCHFRGAVMLYDPETRVLFSGDLLGGITDPGPHDLWAEPGDWGGVRAFHQAYMPAGRAVAAAVRAIRKLDPPVEIIAPQHGRLLRGPLMHRFLDQLEKLPVGLDIMDDVGDGADALAAWSSVLNRVLHIARMVLGDQVEPLLADSDELREACSFSHGRFEVTSAGRWAVGAAVRLLTAGRSTTITNPIRLEAVHACEELELPSPDILLEGEQAVSTR